MIKIPYNFPAEHMPDFIDDMLKASHCNFAKLIAVEIDIPHLISKGYYRFFEKFNVKRKYKKLICKAIQGDFASISKCIRLATYFYININYGKEIILYNSKTDFFEELV